ncbi:MAG: hypothetical protein MRY83_03480 [Flavobacteriales bacterium]|nr:hypothetical protein [Flavobacteriales bacterium]
MIRIFIIVAIILPLRILGQSDEEKYDNYKKNGSIKDRVYFGGGVGAQFGTITLVNFSPIVGYKISDNLSAGVGATYQYLNDRFYNFQSSIFGGSVFGRYNVIPELFLHSEYEILNLKVFNPSIQDFGRVSTPAFLVGGGYNQRIGGRVGFSFMVLWNLLQTNTSFYPYRNPILRGGFSVGF